MTSEAETSRVVRSREGRSTREAILDAATRLMAVRGYTATSVDDVLRESSVGKGNFYHYFRSKEALGLAILEGVVTAFLERTLEPCFADLAQPPLARIRCFLRQLVEMQRARKCVGGCVMGNLAAEMSDVHDGFRTRLAAVFNTWRGRVGAALAEAQRRGDLSATCQPEAIAQLVVASLEGAILMSKVAKDITVMEQCVAELERYLASYEVRA